jgi:hypothetical protein
MEIKTLANSIEGSLIDFKFEINTFLIEGVEMIFLKLNKCIFDSLLPFSVKTDGPTNATIDISLITSHRTIGILFKVMFLQMYRIEGAQNYFISNVLK